MATKPASASVVEKDGQGNQGPDGVWLVREKLTSSIKDKLSKLPPNPTGYCIYKVPERLKETNKDAFTPYVVSIGPFHHQDPRLKAMEDRKLRWLRKFFEEHNSNVFATVDFVARNEANIRQHYEDLGEISSEQFCEMILLDSIFVLGLLLGKIEIEKELTEFDILHDMLLIENQLPLFVPRTIYILTVGDEESFNDRVYKYFSGPLGRSNVLPSNQSLPAHFIEYLRMPYFKIMKQPEHNNLSEARRVEQLESGEGNTQEGQSKSLCSRFSSAPQSENLCSCFFSCFFSSVKSSCSAKELHEAGVKFSATEEGGLNNIEFKGGELKIPHINVNDWTETLFRNLIAFEQCKRLRTKDVCDYIVFMDSLIDTPGDVAILSDANVITSSQHSIGWITFLFNTLYKENISERKSVHDDILEALKKYSKNPWHQWKAKWYKWKQMLKNDYFKSPWSAIALTAATIALILTVIQTACSIIGL